MIFLVMVTADQSLGLEMAATVMMQTSQMAVIYLVMIMMEGIVI